MPVRHVLLAVATAFVWGVNFVVIDIGLRGFPPLLFVALRYSLVAVPAVFFVRRPPISLRHVLAVGLFLSATTQGLLFVSIHAGMPPGLASLVLQVQAAFTVALAVAFLRERPSRGQLGGGLIAFSGTAIIAATLTGHHLRPVALLLCVGAAASWGLGNVAIRAAKAPDALALLVWSSLVPPIPLALLSLALEGSHRDAHALSSASLSSLGALMFVVIAATLFGFGSWTWLLHRHPASKVAPYSLVVPVFGIGTAWLALDEPPSLYELIGAGLVLCGLMLVSAALRLPSRPARDPEPPSEAATRPATPPRLR